MPSWTCAIWGSADWASTRSADPQIWDLQIRISGLVDWSIGPGIWKNMFKSIFGIIKLINKGSQGSANPEIIEF